MLHYASTSLTLPIVAHHKCRGSPRISGQYTMTGRPGLD